MPDVRLALAGRDPVTKTLGLEKIGVEFDKSGYIICQKDEQTSVENVYAIGDVIQVSAFAYNSFIL